MDADIVRLVPKAYYAWNRALKLLVFGGGAALVLALFVGMGMTLSGTPYGEFVAGCGAALFAACLVASLFVGMPVWRTWARVARRTRTVCATQGCGRGAHFDLAIERWVHNDGSGACLVLVGSPTPT